VSNLAVYNRHPRRWAYEFSIGRHNQNGFDVISDLVAI
jgi:hypothetical protein